MGRTILRDTQQSVRGQEDSTRRPAKTRIVLNEWAFRVTLPRPAQAVSEIQLQCIARLQSVFAVLADEEPPEVSMAHERVIRIVTGKNQRVVPPLCRKGIRTIQSQPSRL